MIVTVLQGGCNEIIIPVNLQGDYIVQTNVTKPPAILSPWNVSIQYDNVFWASFDVNTGDPDDIYNFSDLPVHNINQIIVYFCDQGSYYLASDEMEMTITISDESGNIISQYSLDIEVNIQPLYPYPIFIFVRNSPIEFIQDVNVVYAPTTLTLQALVPVGQQTVFNLLLNGSPFIEFSSVLDPCLQPTCNCLFYSGGGCALANCNCGLKCIPQGCILTGSSCLNPNCTSLELYFSCPGYELTVSPSEIIVEYPNYTVKFPTRCGASTDMVITVTLPFNAPTQGTLTWEITNLNLDTPLNCYVIAIYLLTNTVTL
jgi:hypothetical protein